MTAVTRRNQLNLALAVIAIALAAFLWFSRSQPPASPQPLLDIAPQTINRIEIRAANAAQSIILTRTRRQWRLLAPVAARANQNRIDNLLAITRIAPSQRYAASAVAGKDTGLAKPGATVQFNNGPTLVIGSRAPLAAGRDKRYVRLGDTVALAAIPHAGLLDMGWAQWIDPHLLASDAQLQQLMLPEITLSRADTGGWRVTPPSRDQGADAAQATVSAWRHAQALSMTPATSKPAKATVKLAFADGHSRVFDVITRTPQLILRDPELGIAYHLPGTQAAALLDMHHAAFTQPNEQTNNPRQRSSDRTRTATDRSR